MSSEDAAEYQSEEHVPDLSIAQENSIEPKSHYKQPQDTNSDAEKGKVNDVQDEASDPTLPLNWSRSKKFFNMAVPSILCFVT
jgi:hypothetical protein